MPLARFSSDRLLVASPNVNVPGFVAACAEPPKSHRERPSMQATTGYKGLMSSGWFLAAALLVLMILPAMLDLAFDQLRAHRSRPVLLIADTARAEATLAYYNEVLHDSHSV